MLKILASAVSSVSILLEIVSGLRVEKQYKTSKDLKKGRENESKLATCVI